MQNSILPAISLGFLFLGGNPKVSAQKFEHTLGVQFFASTLNKTRQYVGLPGMYGTRTLQEVIFRRG